MPDKQAEINSQIEKDKNELRAAWDDMIAELQNARDAIDNPERFPPEATSRVLAEGYRYLAGFIHHGLERSFHSDPQFPAFRNGLSIFNKSTIENTDAIYFYSPIDGRNRNLIKAKIENFAHWRGEPRATEGRLAPQYLIFETSNGPMSGDTGDMRELMPGVRTGFGRMDISDLTISDEGELELLLAPEKPEGYMGNFICTKKPASKHNPGGDDRYASFVSGRQLFYDWENEEPIHLSIVNLDSVGDHPVALTPEKSAAHLRKMGSIVRGQMHFWLNFYDKLLDVFGTYRDTKQGAYYFPEANNYNKPNAASSDTGGGMSTNIYAGGIFELGDDEALYIEATFTGDPIYTSVHLGNLWGESPDYANHQSSLNLHQMHMGEDGVQRWVVCHRDPGVQNWLDTTLLPKGFLSHRWAYSVLPDKKDWPTIKATKIRFDEVSDYMPKDMPTVSPQERRNAIRIRQEHVQRRFRVF